MQQSNKKPLLYKKERQVEALRSGQEETGTISAMHFSVVPDPNEDKQLAMVQALTTRIRKKYSHL